MSEVVVVTGIGGMGVACARRLGNGRTLVIADFDEAKLGAVVERFTADGFTSPRQRVDVSDRASVDALVAAVRDLGPLRTAGAHRWASPPRRPSPERVLEVDMLGTDYVLERVPRRSSREGTAAVCIASIAGLHVRTSRPCRSTRSPRRDRRA